MELTNAEFQSYVSSTFDSATQRIDINNVTCTQDSYIEWPAPVVINFNNCVFRGHFYIYNIVEDSEVVFNQCEFQGELKILGSQVRVSYKILYCKILNGLELKHSEVFLYLGGSLGQGEFIFDDIKFVSCNLEGFSFTKYGDSDRLSFRNCLFRWSNFRDSVLSNTYFNNSTFESNVSFDRSILHYSIAPGSMNFGNVIFEKDAYFNGTDFTKGAMFNGTRFNGSCIFLACNESHFDCIADFSGSSFEKRAFFDNSRFKVLVLKHIAFKEVVSFNGIQCKEIKIAKNYFLQYADFLNAKIDSASRETFRVIKNEFLKQNNNVEALIYQARELRIYEKSLKWSYSPKEKLVLFLHKISNDFGTNWIRGVYFTVLSCLIFHGIYLTTLSNPSLHWGWRGWTSFLVAIDVFFKYLLKFLVVTHDLDFMSNFKPNALSYLVDSLSRIFIGYGIYQTIQAFRKYGK